MSEHASVKTQGTHLFLIAAIGSDPAEIFKFECPTGITGLGGARDQIDDTCLDETQDRTFAAGLGNPGQVSIPFVYKPTAESHQILFDLKEAAERLQWLVGLSDGVAAPTLLSGAFVQPTDRSGFEFTAYIADINIDIATNEVVRGTLTLQRSGAVVPFFKAP